MGILRHYCRRFGRILYGGTFDGRNSDCDFGRGICLPAYNHERPGRLVMRKKIIVLIVALLISAFAFIGIVHSLA
jgi:hypothetical protein